MSDRDVVNSLFRLKRFSDKGKAAEKLVSAAREVGNMLARTLPPGYYAGDKIEVCQWRTREGVPYKEVFIGEGTMESEDVPHPEWRTKEALALSDLIADGLFKDILSDLESIGQALSEEDMEQLRRYSELVA